MKTSFRWNFEPKVKIIKRRGRHSPICRNFSFSGNSWWTFGSLFSEVTQMCLQNTTFCILRTIFHFACYFIHPLDRFKHNANISFRVNLPINIISYPIHFSYKYPNETLFLNNTFSQLQYYFIPFPSNLFKMFPTVVFRVINLCSNFLNVANHSPGNIHD